MKKISVGLIFIIFCVTCGLFSISATGNKYYDANGNEVSEAEYREIVKKWRESRKKTQELKKYKESVKEYKGRYFDADGNEISEAEYRKNIRKLRDSVLKEKQKEQKKKKKKKSPTSENKIKNKKKRVVKSFKANPDTASEPDDKKPAKEQSEPPLNPLKSDEEFPEKKEKKIAVLSADTEKSVKKYPLWSTETGKNKIYFLGSIHAMKKESYPLPEVITNAYSDSETIVFEADPDQMDNPDMKAKIITIGQYANGHNLMQNISPETLDELKSKLAANGLPLAQFVKFRPWFCALAITITEFKRLGLDPKYGIDAYFFDKAKNDEKKKIFLETPEFQMNLFSKLEKNDQESLLSQTLKGLDVIGTTLSDVTESWKNGDVDKLKSVLKESFKDHPNIYDKFVIQRNKNWMQTVENLTKQDNNAMVIVGCLHLVGENSLIDLLGKKGYDVVQVSEEQ